MNDAARHRHLRAGSYRCDGQQATAVLVPKRKSKQEIFNDVQSDTCQIGGTPGSDTFEELEGRGERVVAHGRRHFTNSVS